MTKVRRGTTTKPTRKPLIQTVGEICLRWSATKIDQLFNGYQLTWIWKKTLRSGYSSEFFLGNAWSQKEGWGGGMPGPADRPQKGLKRTPKGFLKGPKRTPRKARRRPIQERTVTQKALYTKAPNSGQ